MGDVIEVTEEYDDHDDWLIGILRGRTGLFPRSFVIIEKEGDDREADTDAEAEGLFY